MPTFYWEPWRFEIDSLPFEFQIGPPGFFVRLLWFKFGTGWGTSDDELGGVQLTTGIGIVRRMRPENDG